MKNITKSGNNNFYGDLPLRALGKRLTFLKNNVLRKCFPLKALHKVRDTISLFFKVDSL